MGILSRFRDIMASNRNAEYGDRPEKLERFIRELSRELGAVKAETAAVLADERRAKTAWDECRAEIGKLHRYAEKAAEDGDDERARKFLERKAALAAKEERLRAAHEAAAANVAALEQMRNKLTGDIGQLEARYARLKGRWAAAKAQQRVNDMNGGSAALDAMEEKVDAAYNEAAALAELRAGADDDFDAQFAAFERSRRPSAEDELAAIKERLKKKE